MRRAATISILLLSLHSAQSLSQQPPTTGTIEGTVVRSDTGEPIEGAQVSLASVNIAFAGGQPIVGTVTDSAGVVRELIAPVGISVAEGLPSNVAPAGSRPGTFQPVITGPDGKFAFKDLNGGAYRMAATANGFVRQEYGQRAVNGQGRPIFVTAGQAVKDAVLRLVATAAVSGRVYDENGQPATGAPVQLLRVVHSPQGRNFQPVGTGNADDRGDYRVYGVPPGRYYLVAGSQPGPLNRPSALGGGTVGSARFSLVYYPNAADFDQASPIELKSGAEASFDIRVRRQTQTYRVRGRIVNATGTALPANLNVMLGYRTFNGGGTFGTLQKFDPETATFELQNVSPGDYTLQIQPPRANPTVQSGPLDAAAAAARQAEQASRPSASFPIRVVDKDVEGVVLTLTTGVSTTGRITVEGLPTSSVSNINRMRLGINTTSMIFNQTLPVAMPIATDGTFQVVGLREGEYRVQLSGVLPGLYVKSIQYGGEDILTRPLKFGGSGSGTFEVTLRSGAAQINGTVTDAKSQPVPGIQIVLIPEQRSRGDLYRPAITDQSGNFTLSGLAPGEYKLFSWETADNGAYFDPEYLKQYEQQGKTVQISESSNPTVDVKLIPAQ